MRFILTILFLKTTLTFGQSNNVKPCEVLIDTLTKQSVYKAADKMANFPGGMRALYKEIHQRIRFPNSDNLRDGFKVYVAFVVQQNGNVVGQRILKDVSGTNLGEQFLDIIDDFVWEPGFCNGKAVSTIEILPIIIEVK